jgi:hypothetical protein
MENTNIPNNSENTENTDNTEKTNNTHKLQESILTYDDGSCYIGEVLDGKKHGKGILSTIAFVYSAHTRSNQEDNMFAKWNEYEGEWINDKMNGWGKMVRKCRNGNTNVIYEGIWKDGIMLNYDKF